MKSGRQKREEIDKRRAAKATRAKKPIVQEPVGKRHWLKDSVDVSVDRLRSTKSYGTPHFVERGYYLDQDFVCKDCGAEQVWTATQQKWWYEIAQGDVWTTATRCRPCRRREQKRIAVARETHLTGLARKEAKRTEKR